MRFTSLNYHSIDTDGDSVIAVRVEDFGRQMAYLKRRGYRGTSIEEAGVAKKDSQKFVALTFDDGYSDNLTNALPILKKFGFSATIYIVVNFVGATIPWHCSSASGRALSWSQIRQLHADGIAIGSHTMSHPFLTGLSRGDARREIFDSKAALEDAIGAPVRSFAYPAGDLSPETRDMVQEAEYDFGVALVLPWWLPESSYAIPRVGVSRRDTFDAFRIKTSPFYRTIQMLRLDGLFRTPGTRFLRTLLVERKPSCD